MANYVSQIIDAMETQIASTLGGSYSKLKYVYDVEKNTFKGNANRYGVKPMDAVKVAGVVRASTLDHNFEVILTDEYVNSPIDDTGMQAAIENLFDKMNDLEKQLYNSKVGLPSIVLLVIMDSIAETEIIEEHKIVVLRANFLIKYRTQL